MIKGISELTGMFTHILDGLSEEELARRDKEAEEWEIRQQADVIRNNFYGCGMNQTYLSRVGFKDYIIMNENREQELAQTLLKNIGVQCVDKLRRNEYFNLVLCGTYGIGKTFTALCVAKDLCRQKKYKEIKFEKMAPDGKCYTQKEKIEIFKKPCYRTSDLLCAEFYGTKSFSSKMSKQKLIETYLQYDLMIFDEVGRTDNKDEDKVLFEVFDARHNEGLSNIWISNLDFESFKKKVGGAVTSRILQNALIPAPQIFENLPNMRDKRIAQMVG